MESVMQLDNWYVTFESNGGISGDVSRNPNFADATDITTSRVVAFDAGQGVIKTKSGSLYKLMEPKADYEASYPNAKARLFAAYANSVESFTVNASPQPTSEQSNV